jgi:chromosome partition protein MukE
MSRSSFARLEDVLLADDFPEVDLALRRGRHIDRDDGALYSLLVDAQDYLEAFYRRYGCELVQSSDGFFYLLPTTDRLGRRHLSAGEMLVGQALTLLYLDPATVQEGGLVTRDQLLGYLAGLMGSESLLRMFNPKRRRIDERVAEETVRAKVGEALRRLANLGFIELVQEGQMRLRPALMRFAEPVRGSAAPEVALERLVAKGELVLSDAAMGEEPVSDELGEEPEAEGDDDADEGFGQELDPEIYEAEFAPLDEAGFELPPESEDFDDPERER